MEVASFPPIRVILYFEKRRRNVSRDFAEFINEAVCLIQRENKIRKYFY